MRSYRESPLVDGDKVILTPGSEDAMLVALDKLTGKTIWQSKMPGATGGSPGGGPGDRAPGDRPGGPGGGGSGTAPTITGTKDPGLFTSEHFGMSAFST
jgi:outer membrane protein assembly factor BamB